MAIPYGAKPGKVLSTKELKAAAKKGGKAGKRAKLMLNFKKAK